MALSAGYGYFAVGLFLLEFLVATNAIVMVSQLQIQFLLVGRKFFLPLNGWLIVAFFALVDRVTLFPDILAIFVNMMAIGAGDFVFFDMLLVGEQYGSLGLFRPKRRFECDGIRSIRRIYEKSDGEHEYRGKQA